MMKALPTLAIVIPCYNEQEVILHTCKALIDKLCALIDSRIIAKKSLICFVDDGSKDKTWEILKSYITPLESNNTKSSPRDNFTHFAPPH